jgi:hypothetical protein
MLSSPRSYDPKRRTTVYILRQVTKFPSINPEHVMLNEVKHLGAKHTAHLPRRSLFQVGIRSNFNQASKNDF